MKFSLLLLGLGLFIPSILPAQSVIQLDGGKTPASISNTGYGTAKSDSLSDKPLRSGVKNPTLTAFLPPAGGGRGITILILPGKGPDGFLDESQASNVAKQLVEKGIAAFVLNYRIVSTVSAVQDSAAAAALAGADVQKAIAYLRQAASLPGAQPGSIGLLGLSTATALTVGLVGDSTLVQQPDFVGLIYPVSRLSMPPIIVATAPPLFIIAEASGKTNDRLRQAAQLYQTWLDAGIPAEFHGFSGRNQPPSGSGSGWLTTAHIETLVGWLNRLPPTTKAGIGVSALTTGGASKNQPVQIPSPPPQKNNSPEARKQPAATNPVTVVTAGERLPVGSAQPGLVRLSGTVRDSATGRPLAGVAVVIDYQKSITGTSTDAKGHFSIDIKPGEHMVVARLVGYSPARRFINLSGGQARVDFSMITVASQLEEVIVTTKGFDLNTRRPMLGANQLTVGTLKKLPSALGEVDLLRAIQTLPGVTSVGEAANGVNIRGGTTDQNLLLLDDTPIFNPTHMFGLFSVFPPDVLNTVDLYKGNVPARFGGRAAAVLDVSLQNPNVDKFSGSGGISVVSNKLTANMPIVKGKFGVLVSGRGAFSDFLLPLVSKRLSGIRATFGDAVVKTFWRINDRNTLSTTAYFSADNFQTALLANLPNVNGTATRYTYQTLNGMARWFRTIRPRLNLQTTAVYAHYVPKILSPELNSNNVVTLRQSVLQREIKSNLNYQTDNQKIEVGIGGTHYRIEPGTLLPGLSESVNYVTTPTENALELALYADYERSLSDKLAVSLGLRYSGFASLGPSVVRQYAPGEPRDPFSVIDSVRYGAGRVAHTYSGPEPRVGIRYSLSPNASVKFGYNLMRQYLQVVTNTTTPLPTSRWKTSDANISPQVSQLVTAGYSLSFKKNIYELNVEGYYRATQNIIDYRPGADFLLQPNPETQLLQGKSRAYGVETMLSKKKGELTGWLNYTFARTENQVYTGPGVEQNVNGGNWYRANYDRPHTVNANISIDVDKHNNFGLTFAYSTGRPYSAPTGFVQIDGAQYPYYGVRNNNRLPDYHRLDFVWNIYNPGMRSRRWEGRWAFTVYNLYGRNNVYSVFFRTENSKTSAYQLQIFAAPIISLAYNFVFK